MLPASRAVRPGDNQPLLWTGPHAATLSGTLTLVGACVTRHRASSVTSQQQSDYFTVDDVFSIAKGFVLAGVSAGPDTPWPHLHETVGIHTTDGNITTVEVLGLDRSITRSCFSDGSAFRSILIAKDVVPRDALRGARVVGLGRPAAT